VDALHIQLEQAFKDVSSASLKSNLIPISFSRSSPLHIAPKHSAKHSTELVPSHSQEAMQLADAPLLSAIVSFGRRLQRKNGEEVSVRIIISSNFPREVRLRVLRLRFQQFRGDISTTTSTPSLEDFTGPSTFDLTITHADTSNVEMIEDEGGVEKLKTRPGPTTLLSSANLVLCAQGSRSFEYVVSIPILQKVTIKDNTTEAAILSIVKDQESNHGNNDVSHTVVCECVEAEWNSSVNGKGSPNLFLLNFYDFWAQFHQHIYAQLFCA
jgi:hypothetical protein